MSQAQKPLYKKIARRLAYIPALTIDYAQSFAQDQPNKILINGFWRSGTTWIQENIATANEAKTIFEPLCSFAKPPYLKKKLERDKNAKVQLEPYMPLSIEEFSDEDWKYMDQLLKGFSVPVFNYSNRRSIIMPAHRTVVKTIRAPFILNDLMRYFKDLKVVHISRHPCAVIASLKYAKWRWNMDGVKFSELYDVANIKDPELKNDVEILLSYDDQEGYKKFAAFWAITEKYATRIDDKDRFYHMFYENLVYETDEEFEKTYEFLNIENPKEILAEKPSIVSAMDRKNLTKKERTESWRGRLSSEEIDNIQDIVQKIYPAAFSQ